MPESPAEGEFDELVTTLVGAALDAAVEEVLDGHSSLAERERALMPAMNWVCTRLGVQLTRWVGAEGWQALLRRGLDEVARAGPTTGLSQDADGDLRWSDDAPLSDARRECVRLLVAVGRVLARFIGDEMALRLIAQGIAQSDSTSGQGPEHG